MENRSCGVVGLESDNTWDIDWESANGEMIRISSIAQVIWEFGGCNPEENGHFP
jgi:hypothetical protein